MSNNKSKRDFINSLSYDILKYVIFGIIYGSIGLYTCKIAQSNVLPDKMAEVPFGQQLTSFGDSDTDHSIIANLTKEYDWHGMGWVFGHTPKIQGQLIEFDNKQVLDTYFNGFYGTLYKNKYSSSNLALYYYNIFSNIFASGNGIINFLFYWMNKLPEWMILVLFPFFGHLLVSGMGVFHMGASIFFHAIYLKDFFLKKVERNEGDESVPHLWEKYDDIKYLKLFPILTIMFFLFSGGVWLSVMTVTAISFLSWIFTPLYVSFYKNKSEHTIENEFTLFQYIGDIVSSHWQLMIIMTSLITIYNSNKYLGGYYTLGVVIAMLIAITHNMYNQKIPENADFPYSYDDLDDAYIQKPKNGDIDVSEEQMYNILMGRFKPPA
jgi:hypothetical protein